VTFASLPSTTFFLAREHLLPLHPSRQEEVRASQETKPATEVISNIYLVD
jgi:hypothetical protein